jgi:hypothetical protein
MGQSVNGVHHLLWVLGVSNYCIFEFTWLVAPPFSDNVNQHTSAHSIRGMSPPNVKNKMRHNLQALHSTWNLQLPPMSMIRSVDKVRSPIPSVYAGFYIVYYKDIGEFQILYLQDMYWKYWCLSPKISGPFWWILGLNMYLLIYGAMIKMKWCFSTTNCKILYLTMLIVCRKISLKVTSRIARLLQLKWKKKFFWWGALIVVNVLKFNRN